MDDIQAKRIAARTLRARGFTAAIVSHALSDDPVGLITEAGAAPTDLTMRVAGRSLAAHAIEATPPEGTA